MPDLAQQEQQLNKDKQGIATREVELRKAQTQQAVQNLQQQQQGQNAGQPGQQQGPGAQQQQAPGQMQKKPTQQNAMKNKKSRKKKRVSESFMDNYYDTLEEATRIQYMATRLLQEEDGVFPNINGNDVDGENKKAQYDTSAVTNRHVLASMGKSARKQDDLEQWETFIEDLAKRLPRLKEIIRHLKRQFYQKDYTDEHTHRRDVSTAQEEIERARDKKIRDRINGK